MARSQDKNIQKAIWSYEQQVSRCGNKKNPYYKHYGAKGLSVEYSCKEFISWWLQEKSNFRGKIPTVSRIDHDKGYSFDNIKMEDKGKNTAERNVRVCSRATFAFRYPTYEFLGLFRSGRAAARHFGIAQCDVRRTVNYEYKQTHGMIFRSKFPDLTYLRI